MPIRFRCPTCTGLMSIARRKGGQVVTCPKCGERVIVPADEPAKVAVATTSSTSDTNRPLFERTDFDSLLSTVGVAPPPTPAKPVAPTPVPVPEPEPTTIILSHQMVAMLGVGAAALVVASFAAGYLLK